MQKLLTNIISCILMNIIFCLHKLKRLTSRELLQMETNKEKVCLIFVNLKNISHNMFMDELHNYLQIKP